MAVTTVTRTISVSLPANAGYTRMTAAPLQAPSMVTVQMARFDTDFGQYSTQKLRDVNNSGSLQWKTNISNPNILSAYTPTFYVANQSSSAVSYTITLTLVVNTVYSPVVKGNGIAKEDLSQIGHVVSSGDVINSGISSELTRGEVITAEDFNQYVLGAK